MYYRIAPKIGGGTVTRTVNFKLLKQMLSLDSSEEKEIYEFTWPGKNAAIIKANTLIKKTLRPVMNDSLHWNETRNIYIEGDNLDALKLLQESYLEKVKMIYIDPPYNTGNDFIYDDHFNVRLDEYEKSVGNLDESNQRLIKNTNSNGRFDPPYNTGNDFIYDDHFNVRLDEYEKSVGNLDESNQRLIKNTNSNGRFHSDWCSMIYPRLMLAKNLLKQDGVIFISIDDNELNNLLKIASEIFGENNYIASIPWRKRTAKSDVPFGVSQDYEWIVAFAKSDKFLARVEGKQRKYYESDDFPGEPWRIHDLTKQTTASERPNSYFTIVNPKNGKNYPADSNRTWAITAETFKSYYNQNRIIFPGDYDFLRISKPVLRYWKSDDMKKAGENFGRVALSSKLPDDIGMSQDGTKEISELFGGKVFSYPKPTSLIKYLVTASTGKDDLILDFFSGSSTTADAVMQANSEDNGDRKYILVQLPEACDPKSEAYQAGFQNICEIGKERIRRAGLKLQSKSVRQKNLDTGFRVFRIDSSNMKDVYYSPDEYSQNILDMLSSNIKEDRTSLDLLFGCLVDWGLPLSLPYSSEMIDGFEIHDYNVGDLIACFDDNLTDTVLRKIAEKKPLRVVLRDSGFDDNASKINILEIFKTLSPDTSIRVI